MIPKPEALSKAVEEVHYSHVVDPRCGYLLYIHRTVYYCYKQIKIVVSVEVDVFPFRDVLVCFMYIYVDCFRKWWRGNDKV